LQINGQVSLCLAANFRQGRCIFIAIDGDANNVSASRVERVYLCDGGINVLRVCGGHALNRDWMTGSDLN
jgi:hypothetical protein